MLPPHQLKQSRASVQILLSQKHTRFFRLFMLLPTVQLRFSPLLHPKPMVLQHPAKYKGHQPYIPTSTLTLTLILTIIPSLSPRSSFCPMTPLKMSQFDAEFISASSTTTFRMSTNSAANICKKYSNLLLTFLTCNFANKMNYFDLQVRQLANFTTNFANST